MQLDLRTQQRAQLPKLVYWMVLSAALAHICVRLLQTAEGALPVVLRRPPMLAVHLGIDAREGTERAGIEVDQVVFAAPSVRLDVHSSQICRR